MHDQENIHHGTSFLVVAASFVIILWGINQAQSVIVLILVALFLAVIGASPLLWLKRKKVPSVLAVLIVLAGMVIILLITGGFVATSLASFSGSLPFYQKRIEEDLLALRSFLAS